MAHLREVTNLPVKNVTLNFVGDRPQLDLQIMPGTTAADVLRHAGFSDDESMVLSTASEEILRETDDVYANAGGHETLWVSGRMEAGC